MRIRLIPITAMMVPVTTGGKNRSIRLTSGAISMAITPDPMIAPKISCAPAVPEVLLAMLTIGATAAKVTPIITGSRIDPFWFTSVRDTVAFTLMPDQPRDIRAIYVSDMAQATSWEDPGATNWIDARKAFFVIESRKQGRMGAAEAVPFGDRGAAAAFAAANGGRVVLCGAIASLP